MTKEEFLTDAGFTHMQEVPNRGLCGLYRMIFTVGLCYQLQDDMSHMYDGRYCYESHAEALEALRSWNGEEDPSGNWIKHKGITEYSNPKRETQDVN